MTTLMQTDLADLLKPHEPPCLTLYMRSHPSYPESQQDPIRYRNLLERIEAEVRERLSATQTQALTARFRELVSDEVFWSHQSESLAVLGNRDDFRVFHLPCQVEERAEVADTFHLKPLMGVLQSADRFHVLCLRRDEIELYEGNRYALHKIEPPEICLTGYQALERNWVERRPQPLEAEAPGRKDAPHKTSAQYDANLLLDVEQFFRIVDRDVNRFLSQPAGVPLVLAALPDHQSLFRSVSNNPHLVNEGIDRGPPQQIDEEFRDAAWKCVEPRLEQRLQQIKTNFEVARARNMASDDVLAVGAAVAEDRVGKLLIEQGRMIPGRFDAVSRQLDFEGAQGDLLEDLAEQVVRANGDVLIVSPEKMPVRSGVAAIYRF